MAPVMGTSVIDVEKEDASLQPLVSVSVLSWCVLVPTRLWCHLSAYHIHIPSDFLLLPTSRFKFVEQDPCPFIHKTETKLLYSTFFSPYTCFDDTILHILFLRQYSIHRTLLLNCQIITFNSVNEYCLRRWTHGFIFSLACLGIFLHVKYLSFHHVTSPRFAAVFCCMKHDQILIDSIFF